MFRTFIDNLRKNLEKNKEMQENLKAFEEERDRIVKNDAVKLFKEKLSGTQVCVNLFYPSPHLPLSSIAMVDYCYS